MAFKYKLQKFLEIRIKKKEEQMQVVIKAQQEVNRIEILIQKNKMQIKQTISDMKKADPHTYESYDKFLKHLYEIEKKLLENLKEANDRLEFEKNVLREREKEVDVLDKHKENKREEYIKEEKAAELKLLNEVGSQKHFAKTRENKE